MRTSDGVELAVRVVEGAGDRGDLWFSHATGFCGACWGPVIEQVRPSVRRIIVWDFRGHGRSGRVVPPVSWWDMAGDVADIMGEVGTADGPTIGVGHSMGGAALVMAELTKPGTFDGLVLVEPILLGDPIRRTGYPLADVVRKRRRVFESRERALMNFSRKLPFSRWDRTALEGYVADGLRDGPDGLELACVPEFEAEVYDTAHGHGSYRLIGRLAPPVTVIVGDRSDTYDVNWARSITSAMPRGELVVVAGGTHFIPMEQPVLVAREVRRMASALEDT